MDVEYEVMTSLGLTPEDLLQRLTMADEFGVKLEVVQDSYSWEFFPSSTHQKKLRAVARSLKPSPRGGHGCDCFELQDTYIRFADGSVKRPDLMVFCKEPPTTRDALTAIPEAIVEILSPGGERKDIDIGAPFYLLQGVKDVIVVNPETGVVHHFRRGSVKRLEGPVAVELECGCSLEA